MTNLHLVPPLAARDRAVAEAATAARALAALRRVLARPDANIRHGVTGWAEATGNLSETLRELLQIGAPS